MAWCVFMIAKLFICMRIKTLNWFEVRNLVGFYQKKKENNTVQLAEKMTLNKLVWNVQIVYFCFWNVKCSRNANKLNFLKSKLLFKCFREVWLWQNVSEVKRCLCSRLLVGYTLYRENSLTNQEIWGRGLILLCFWISVSSSAKWGVNKIYRFPIAAITN